MLEVAARCFHVVLIRTISASVQKPKWGVLRKDICDNRAGRAAPYGQVREMPKGREESRAIMFVSESLFSPNPFQTDGSPWYSSKMETFHLFFWSCSLISIAEISVSFFFFFFFFPEAAEMGSGF